jgi:AcrR family transcriptional regulator
MKERVKSKRPYRSTVRAERARRTRAHIVESARELFLERGFSATTIAAIADHAGVAPETIYAVYRTKGGVLEAVVRAAVLRDDEPEEVLERSWVSEVLRLPDLPARIKALARHTAGTLELTSPVYAIIRDAGTGAGELDGLNERLREWRFGGQAQAVTAIVDGQKLRPELTVEQAADTFSALASPELYHSLTADRGWSQRRYGRWLEQTAKFALVPD